MFPTPGPKSFAPNRNHYPDLLVAAGLLISCRTKPVEGLLTGYRLKVSDVCKGIGASIGRATTG